MDKQEAFERIANGLTEGGIYLSEECEDYLRGWCDGTGRDHEPREVTFASDDGKTLVGNLSVTLRTVGAPLLDAIVEARRKVAPETPGEATPHDLWVMGRVLGVSGTLLCNEDLEPAQPTG